MSRATEATATQIRLRPLDLRADLERMSAWAAREHVQEFWPDLGRSAEEVRRYLDAKIQSEHIRPHIVVIGGVDAGYVELYDYNRDPVARIFPGEPGDRGWHIFLGEQRFIGTGRAVEVGRAVLRTLFEYALCRRVLCEPDERNARMLNFVAKLGHRRIGTAVLPDKIAAIMACERADFERSLDLGTGGRHESRF